MERVLFEHLGSFQRIVSTLGISWRWRQLLSGGVIRSSSGIFVAALSNFYGSNSITFAKMMVICEGINLAACLGLSNLLVESDSLIVINILSESMSCPWNLIYLKRAIAKNYMSLDISFKHVYRELNGAALGFQSFQ
ncbi:uncharacterized protein LOC119986942 [Tripterygium wilfordii]|uniref:uncharacterized protein LOC119986942 n=1 Tax=Tripterygium wilfordii TaxID=458696 RepID=UPI0018F81F19|nr:uncharacterized protein LOC119986942 [Tripterygium wilfordii]